MKDSKVYMVLAIIVVIFIIVIIPKGKKEENNNSISNNLKNNSMIEANKNQPQNDKQIINITQEKLKESIEKIDNGIEVSNVKLNSNNDNSINVSLVAKNENNEEKNVTISVKYFNKDNKQIGENGFFIGEIKPGESKEVESLCYFEEKDVNQIKIDISADSIKVDTSGGSETAGIS